LLALMLLHDSRRGARINPAGEMVLLEDQNRGLWNRGYIEEGIQTLRQALALHNPGPYQVQAAISALHAEAHSASETDWRQIAKLYHILEKMSPSPVVRLNRAVAVAMSEGPQVGLRLLYPLAETMSQYYPYHVALADLLRRSNQREAAADAFQRALSLCSNRLERDYLQRQIDLLS
jgi:RNA polymerase sigma-70 factor (ECF subfamily)